MSDAYICRFSDVCIFAFRLFDALSHSSRNQLTRLNHFSLAAYGFQLPLPTLNQVRHHNWPKAEYEMRSVALFRWHFQPLAEVHFRGAPKSLIKTLDGCSLRLLRQKRSIMSHKFIFRSTFHSLLIAIDREIAEATRKKGCDCGGALHQSNYPRSPFGLSAEFRIAYEERFSFCCADCRKRTTPSSVRFFGRRWYRCLSTKMSPQL